MDSLDRRIITALRHDGRRSISDLAQDLNTTRATVRARLDRLTKAGEIVGFTVILRSDAIEQPVRGIMLIEVGGQGTDAVIRNLSGFSEVSAIHTTNGRWDLVVELATADLIQFDRVLRQIRLIAGVTASETNLLLATPRSTKAKL
ncbi:Lrp/AsnC family transcriptional regulator [Bosea sp. (in: a-proteobacteria)]|uniref:Lrp/AsnC family transcriptional regulator n=1 Tax=Bosea sp. (in: a-proteobacteria) TaxID=1871050 RepID=UPI003B3A0915